MRDVRSLNDFIFKSHSVWQFSVVLHDLAASSASILVFILLGAAALAADIYRGISDGANGFVTFYRLCQREMCE